MKRAESVPKDDKLFRSFVDFCSSQPCALCMSGLFPPPTVAPLVLPLFLSDSTFSLCLSTHCHAAIKYTVYLIRALILKRGSNKETDTVFTSIIISKIRYDISAYGSNSKTIEKNNRILERCHEKGFSPTKRQRTSHLERRRQQTRAKHYEEPKASTSRLSHQIEKQEQSFPSI